MLLSARVTCGPPESGRKRVAFLLFAVGWGANHFAALLFGMYAAGLVPSLLFSGPLSDRYGRRAIVLPAAALALIASAIAGGVPDHFAALVAARTFYGVAAGAVMSPGAVWLLELSKDAAPGAGARRATIALSAGFAFGPLIAGVLAQYLPHPTVLPFVAHAAALSCALAIALRAPAPGLTASVMS